MRRVFKRAGSFFMAAVMAFSLAACGKNEQKDAVEPESLLEDAADKEDKPLRDDVTTLSDALKKLSTYTKGSYELSVKLAAADEYKDDPSRNFNGELLVTGETSGADLDVNLSFSGGLNGIENEKDYGRLLVLCDGAAYVDLDSIIAAYSDEGTGFGSLRVILPKINKLAAAKELGGTSALAASFLDKALDGLDTKAEDGVFSLRLDEDEDYLALLENVVGWADENEDDIVKSMIDASDVTALFDPEDYAHDLVNEYYDDFLHAIGIIAVHEDGLEEMDELDSLLAEKFGSREEFEDEIKRDLSEIVSEFGINQSEEDVRNDLREVIDEIKDELENNRDEIAEDFSFLDRSDLTLSLSLYENSYEISLTGVIADEDYEMNVDLCFSFKSADVSVTAPENVNTLSGIVSYYYDEAETIDRVIDDMSRSENSPLFSSYFVYVKRARLLEDAAVLSELIKASDEVIADSEYYEQLLGGAEFIISLDEGRISISASVSGYDPTEDFLDAAVIDDTKLSLSSETFKEITGSLVGKVDELGGIFWSGEGELADLLIESGLVRGFSKDGLKLESKRIIKSEEMMLDVGMIVSVKYDKEFIAYSSSDYENTFNFNFGNADEENVGMAFFADIDYAYLKESYNESFGAPVEERLAANGNEYECVWMEDVNGLGDEGLMMDCPEIDGVIIFAFRELSHETSLDIAKALTEGLEIS